MRDQAPKACGGKGGCCPSLPHQAREMNKKWVGKVNEELLHPQGYSAEAKAWVARGGKGEKQFHMNIRITQRIQLAPAADEAGEGSGGGDAGQTGAAK